MSHHIPDTRAEQTQTVAHIIRNGKKMLVWFQSRFCVTELCSLAEYRKSTEKMQNMYNTPGTAGGPGGRDQTLAVRSRKNARKSAFFCKKIKIT